MYGEISTGTDRGPAATSISVPDVADLFDLTQHEIQALRTRWNLADAHTHQRQSASQDKIVSRLPDLWYEAEESQQALFEQSFTDAFFRLHKQPTAAAMGRTWLSYSASVSTMTAAMYLMQRSMSVALVEPCFDNLVDLLKNMRIRLTALPEEALADPSQIYQNLRRIDADSIYLVDPNNPTGFSLLKDGVRGFQEVVRYCADFRKVLLIDLCFASFALCDDGVGRFDIYRLLEDSGISYMAIEDTGKTWPVQDAKCAMLTVSEDLREHVYNIHTAVLLNVSPFVLNFLTHYIEDSIEDGLASVRDVISENRAAAREAVAGTILEHVEPVVNTSVAWFRIRPDQPTASELQARLLVDEIYVLPGSYFYWSDHARGERYLRIALARRPATFASAMRRMREALIRYGH